ncbi:MAG: hypothetical protein Kow00114_35250 [Kiloniellaceae bacterium]
MAGAPHKKGQQAAIEKGYRAAQPPGAGWFLRQPARAVKPIPGKSGGGAAPSPSRCAGPSLSHQGRGDYVCDANTLSLSPDGTVALFRGRDSLIAVEPWIRRRRWR